MENLRTDKKELLCELRKRGTFGLRESRCLGEVYIMLTLDCNLRCRFCSWWGRNGACRKKGFLKEHSRPLRLGELKKFADQIAPFRPMTVTLSGGEPLLNRNWYPLAGYLKEKGIKVTLTTNGVYFLKEFGKITETIDEVNLSLDAPPGRLQAIRGYSESHFTRILKGLKKITEYKKRQGRPALRIFYTIFDRNYIYMDQLVRFMEKNRIAIDQYYFQHLMFLSEKNMAAQRKVLKEEFSITRSDIWDGFVSSPASMDFMKFREEIKKVKRRNNVIFSPDLSFRELKPYYQENRVPDSYRRLCSSAWHQLNVLPNGDLYICNDYFIGNLKEAAFENLWNSGKARDLREYVSQKLFPACRGCFNFYWERKG
ncbi:MAG: radical SAM protein [bacterium]|nr:radical SAM protein [bacterium]